MAKKLSQGFYTRFLAFILHQARSAYSKGQEGLEAPAPCGSWAQSWVPRTVEAVRDLPPALWAGDAEELCFLPAEKCNPWGAPRSCRSPAPEQEPVIVAGLDGRLFPKNLSALLDTNEYHKQKITCGFWGKSGPSRHTLA